MGTLPVPSAIPSWSISHRCRLYLHELRRVLKPGAPFIFCVPNPRYLTELSVPGFLGRLGLTGAGRAYIRLVSTHVAGSSMPSGRRSGRNGWKQAGFSLERWWHYFSPQAMRMLEWGHYFGAPTLLPHASAKRWIIAPWRWNLFLTERFVGGMRLPNPIHRALSLSMLPEVFETCMSQSDPQDHPFNRGLLLHRPLCGGEICPLQPILVVEPLLCPVGPPAWTTDGRVLELGCGMGHLLTWLTDRYQVVWQ